MEKAIPVSCGIDLACRDPRVLGTGPFALLTNATGTTRDLRRSVDGLLTAGVDLRALMGPEHGLHGSVQAAETETSERDETTGLPVVETYRLHADELDARWEGIGVDALVVDLQDIGVRYYTYVWSMLDVMASAARTGRRCVVLDRPNPLGGLACAGPGLDARFASFVGRVDVPLRHGLTIGELARLFNRHAIPALAGRAVDLDVVPLRGWRREMWFDHTGLAWVAPSPNMPTPATALAFSGTGLFEGTTLSEGRGTTQPFEVLGAPFVDRRLVGAARDLRIPGIAFREVWFTPTFHKYRDQTVRGVALHIIDRDAAEPVEAAVALMRLAAELYPDDFAFLPPDGTAGGDGADEGAWPIDRLWGSDQLRNAVTSGLDPAALLRPRTTPDQTYPAGVLLY